MTSILIYQSPCYRQKFAAHGIEPSYWERQIRALAPIKPFWRVRALFSPSTPYLVHRQPRRDRQSLRHIARILTIGGQRVCCLLDLMTSEEEGYRQFCRDAEHFGARALDQHIDEKEIRKWLERPPKNRVHLEIQDHRDEPPSGLRPWLAPTQWTTPEELTIYESNVWVERAKIEPFCRLWGNFATLIEDAVLGEGDVYRPTQTDYPWLKCLSNKVGSTIAFCKVKIEDIAFRSDAFLLLGQWEQRPTIDEIRGVLVDFAALSNAVGSKEDPTLTIDDIARASRRSYPYYLVSEYSTAWSRLESDAEANLALSGEEMNLLLALSQKGTEKVLPLFVNGRAGSGKSTMLYYIFADYCWRKCQLYGEAAEGTPLFLSYNDKLIELARKSVANLLDSHSRFHKAPKRNWEQDTVDFFQPFQSYLKSLLPNHEREQFREDKHINFLRFRQLFHKHLPAGIPEEEGWRLLAPIPVPPAGLTAEASWHALRTFTKGYWFHEFMGPADYFEVPRRERSLSDDTFVKVHRLVWEQWYRDLTTKKGYWDDQDLVRRVLQLNLYFPSHSAIICDEAQDFTRIELQLLLRFSIFSRYQFRPDDNLPLVFAGDPFQTLNPTGFRWSRMKRIFHDELISSLNPDSPTPVGVNFQELRCNYRSSKAIVKVINLLQFWRRSLFDLEEILPQQSWKDARSHEPQRFILKQNLDLESFKKQIAQTVILVPCEEGEERTFAEEDPQLSSILKGPDGPAVLRNVFSAIAVKGLEFNRVVLYKFGEFCPASVWERVQADDEDRQIEAQHFFNKLYVAASRAKSWLFVVDTINGEKKLWAKIEEGTTQQVLAARKEISMWADHIAPIRRGKTDDISQLREDRPEDNASELVSKGKNLRNPDYLLRAALYYRQVSRKEEADICEAWASRFSGHFRKAGLLFEEHSQLPEAKETYRDGLCWPELRNLLRQTGHDSVQDKIDFSIAAFMCSKPTDESAYLQFSDFLVEMIREQRLGSPLNSQWISVIAEYQRRLANFPSEAFSRERYKTYAPIFQELYQAHYPGMLEMKGDCLYRAGDYAGAVLAWEKSAATESRAREYWFAKAKSEDFPEAVKWLEKLGDYDRILQEWRARKRPLIGEWIAAVRTALEKQGKTEELIDVLLRLSELDEAYRTFRKIYSTTIPTSAGPKAGEILRAQIKSKAWVPALTLCREILQQGDLESSYRVSNAAHFIRAAVTTEIESPGSFNDLRTQIRPFMEEMLDDTKSLSASIVNALRVEEVGAACELFTREVFALTFYERHLRNPNDAIAEHARDRWIVCKRRHINNTREREKRVREEARLADHLRMWRKPSDINPNSMPDLSHLTKIILRNLPAGVHRDDLPGGDLRLTFKNIEMRTVRKNRLFNITDVEAGLTTRIDLAKRELSGPGQSRLQADNQEMSFDSHDNLFNGSILWAGNKAAIRIRLSGLQDPLDIEMPF